MLIKLREGFTNDLILYLHVHKCSVEELLSKHFSVFIASTPHFVLWLSTSNIAKLLKNCIDRSRFY